MRRPTRSALVATALLAVTACGGSTVPDKRPSDGPGAVTAPFASDRDFTPAQLAAALPTAKQVPDSRTVELTCRPGRATRKCAPVAGATYAQVVLSTDHTTRKPVIDHRRKGPWRAEQYTVIGKRFADAAAAEKAYLSQVQSLAGANGPVNTAARKTPGGGEEWGTRGTGKVTQDKVNGFTGVRADATIKDVDTAGRTSVDMQVAVTVATWGRESATVRVVFWAAHHRPGDAMRRADAVMEQYLERLGTGR